MLNRFVLQICGESGQGVNSLGDIVAKSLKDNNYYIFGYREYPSLIKGGVAGYQIVFGPKVVNSPSKSYDLLISMSRESFSKYIINVKKGGYVLFSFGKLVLSKEDKDIIDGNELNIVEYKAEEIAINNGGTKTHTNTAILGLLSRIFKLDKKIVTKILVERYGKTESQELVNKKIFSEVFEKDENIGIYDVKKCKKSLSEYLNMSANQAISLGLISSGCRAYFHYPMTPVTSISSYLEKYSKKFKNFVFQCDDEIAAAQMALASAYAGTRSATATSGGGFDLMTETLSMAGMAEIPLVIILGQRPGPSTGMPTWSSDSDLNVALYGGHGEFGRIVVSISSPKDAYRITQEAFNFAEIYQVPVIILTDKHMGESLFLLDNLPKDIKVERGNINYEYVGARYIIDKNYSPIRSIPGLSKNLTNYNSDEHDELGNSTESGVIAKEMQDRRVDKLDDIKQNLPIPKIFSKDSKGDLLIISWGGTSGAIQDAINSDELRVDIKLNYLHINYIYPVNPELKKIIKGFKKVLFVEQNCTGQLESLYKQELGFQNAFNLRKYDGRPFYAEEIVDYINSLKFKK